MTDEDTPAATLLAKATEQLNEKTGGEDVYVPAVNLNYIPEGIVRPEGWVPPLNGGNLDDFIILKQKAALEDDPVNNLESGPHEDNEWVDPSPIEPTDPTPPDPEAPIDQSAQVDGDGFPTTTEQGTSQGAKTGGTSAGDSGNSSGLPTSDAESGPVEGVATSTSGTAGSENPPEKGSSNLL